MKSTVSVPEDCYLTNSLIKEVEEHEEMSYETAAEGLLLLQQSCKTPHVRLMEYRVQQEVVSWKQMNVKPMLQLDAFFEKLPAIIRPCAFRFYWVVDAWHVKTY